MEIKKYLTRAESADYTTARGLPTTKGNLAKLACTGGGPAYRLFGNKALYTKEDLIDWAESRLSDPRSNTSDKAQRG